MSELLERLDSLPPEKFRYALLGGPTSWVAAGRCERLYRLLTDVRFLAVKIKEFKTGSVLEDYDLILTAGGTGSRARPQAVGSAAPEAAPAALNFETLRLLKRVLSQASHLLDRCETRGEIVSTLHSRLPRVAQTSELVAAAERDWSYPFFTAHRPLPDKTHPALIRTLVGHKGGVDDCALSADGAVMASVSLFHEMIVWDGTTGSVRWCRQNGGDARRCALSADGTLLIAICGYELHVWDVPGRALSRVIATGHRWEINRCVLSADGRLAVTAAGDLQGDDNTLKVWDLQGGRGPLTLRGHRWAVNDCAISADGRTIVSASSDKTLKVWDADTGAKRLTLRGHRSQVNGCAVSADGAVIVSASGFGTRGGEDNTVRVWDGATGRLIHTLRGHGGRVQSCAVSADGSVVVSASADNILRVWDAATGISRMTLAAHTGEVRRCALTPDGATLISAAADGTIKVWDVRTHAPLPDILHESGDAQLGIAHCAVSADGRTFVTTSGDGLFNNLTVWDAQSARQRAVLSGHDRRVNGCAINPSGSIVVSASEDTTLRVWKVRRRAKSYKSRKPHLVLVGHRDGPTRPSPYKLFRAFKPEGEPEYRGWVNKCALSPDGSFIVSASSDRTLKVWDAATGGERATLRGHTDGVYDCAVSRDGKFIVSASGDKTLKVWDAAAGVERLTLFGHAEWVTSCAIYGDNLLIISASGDATLKVWDAHGGAERLTLRGHTGVVTDCEFDPAGKFILSTSQDGRLKLWEAVSGECIATLHVDAGLSACAWFPDGEHILAVGGRGLYLLRLANAGAGL